MAETSSTRLSRSSTSRRTSRTSTRTGTSTRTLSESIVSSLVPTSSLSETPLSTLSVSPASTTLTVAPTSTWVDTPGSVSARGPSALLISLAVILSILVLGVAAFVVIFFMRRRAGKPLFSKEVREPKRMDSHPQSSLPDSSIYLPSKERDADTDTIAKSRTSSIDSDAILSPTSKFRSSRASSSIFADDRVTIASPANYHRPLSLGEPKLRGVQGANGSTTQRLSESDRRNSNGVRLERSLSPIPGTPATPGITFAPADSTHGYDEETGLAQPPQALVSSRSEARHSNPPALGASLAPLPASLYAFDPKRISTNSLTPSRYGPSLADSRPQSMASMYSIQTQNLPMVLPDSLSPDVLATLDRLSKRVSRPWSMSSVDTYRFNRMTPAPTEEG